MTVADEIPRMKDRQSIAQLINVGALSDTDVERAVDLLAVGRHGCALPIGDGWRFNADAMVESPAWQRAIFLKDREARVEAKCAVIRQTEAWRQD